MKRIFFTLSLILVATFIFPQTVNINLSGNNNGLSNVKESSESISFTSSLNSINIEKAIVKDFEFFQIYINGFTKNQHIGEPNTPAITQLIEIPLGAEIAVKIIDYQEQLIDLKTYNIINVLDPVQRSISKSEDEKNVEFTKDDVIYNTNSFYANDLVKVEILGIARDKRLARITISPIQYNPVTNEIKVIYNINAKISFINSDFNATYELKKKTSSPYFYANKKLTLNNITNNNKDVITHYPTKMVIVSDPMFETLLQPYIQWKIRKGFTVIEAYTNNTNVGTTTTSIKNYLESLYNAATAQDPAPSFVLFVGDVAQIPTFDGTTSSHKTDLYYCEYTGDFFPEVYYGRWSAENVAQLKPQIDKTLEYEQYLMPDPSYLADILLVAGVDQEGGDPDGFSSVHGNGQLEYGMTNYFNAAHGISVFEYLYPLSDVPASAQNIRDDFNLGVSFANYTAHCSADGWVNPSFVVNNVPNMTNNHKYSLMVGNCCQSNTFWDTECFGEAVLRKSDGGAIGYIGGSNYSYWDEDYHWGVGAKNIQSNPSANYDATKLGAYDRAFHENSEAEIEWFITNAAIMIAGNMAVEQAGDGMKDYYWEIYHLMGDPSIMTYFGVPSALSVTYNNPLTVGETSLNVSTEQYSYVAISQDNVLLDVQYSGTNTSVTLTFPAFSTIGFADIVVTKQNRQPFINTVEIVNNNASNDVGISTIINPLTSYSCSGLTEIPKVVIRNGGQNNLTSFTISCTFDSETPEIINWTGNLSTNEADTIEFESIVLTLGNHTLSVSTSLPNGVVDEYLGNNDKERNIVVVENIIDAQFTSSEQELCAPPLTVDFTNTSTNASAYVWDFGDGTNSTETNPSHIYTDFGLFTVKLIADAGICGSDSIILEDYIFIDESLACSYCESGASGDYEYIDGVECGDINNQNTGLSEGGYADYTNKSTEMFAGETYSITVTGGSVYRRDNMYAWIDWNGDIDFNDTDEYIYFSTNDGQDSYTFDVTAPLNIETRETRMRIRWTDDSDEGTIDEPCDISSYGEVEDYTISLIGLTNINSLNNENCLSIYPNPNNGIFTISSLDETSNIEILNVLGEIIYQNTLNQNILNVDLSSFQTGVYLVKISTNNAVEIRSVVIK